VPNPSFTFVDLFAGIGGFHAALGAVGGRCVHAVEIDPAAAAVYRRNWGLDPLGDIADQVTDADVAIPAHDVLAAGFPCQPFSKSGAQRGMDEARGTLFWDIARIIEARRPAVVLLENVRNLAGPRHVHEWQVIISTLRELGYRASETPAVFSPHLLPPELGGRPQLRERVFITATFDPDGLDAELPVEPPVRPQPIPGWDPQRWDLAADLPLDDHDVPGCQLSPDEQRWIDAWDDFVQVMWEEREGRRLPGFPIWADSWVPTRELRVDSGWPKWKADFIRKNAAFYDAHSDVIDAWHRRWHVERFPPSRRKLEWQAQDSASLWDCVIHMRPSGIRAKRPTYLPALVAITQTSIIGPRRRRLSPREAARLQGLPEWFDFGDQRDGVTYRQLGNGVSVGAVWHVLRSHVARDSDLLERSCPGLLEAVTAGPSLDHAPARTLLPA
jgi:DNA (cytosine-5)-methyltransferase 1